MVAEVKRIIFLIHSYYYLRRMQMCPHKYVLFYPCSHLGPIGPEVWKLSQIYELMTHLTPMSFGYQRVIFLAHEYAYVCQKLFPIGPAV